MYNGELIEVNGALSVATFDFRRVETDSRKWRSLGKIRQLLVDKYFGHDGQKQSNLFSRSKHERLKELVCKK